MAQKEILEADMARQLERVLNMIADQTVRDST